MKSHPVDLPETVNLQTLSQLGPSLERLRKLRGWSQELLAEKAGVRQGTVSDIERNRKVPTMRTFMLLLSILDFDLKLHARSRQKNPYEGLF
jgi:HTH-type transcriptional regulator/antitoxin HipB